jgi:hypothetical protein
MTAPIALTPMQHGVLAFDLRFPGYEVCNIGGYVALKGIKDCVLFIETIRVAIESNPIFRTRLSENFDSFVFPDGLIPIIHFDFSGMPREKAISRAQRGCERILMWVLTYAQNILCGWFFLIWVRALYMPTPAFII